VREAEDWVLLGAAILTAYFLVWLSLVLIRSEINISLIAGPRTLVRRAETPLSYWLLIAFFVAVTAVSAALTLVLRVYEVARLG
jgi:hypothetical protein